MQHFMWIPYISYYNPQIQSGSCVCEKAKHIQSKTNKVDTVLLQRRDAEEFKNNFPEVLSNTQYSTLKFLTQEHAVERNMRSKLLITVGR